MIVHRLSKLPFTNPPAPQAVSSDPLRLLLEKGAHRSDPHHLRRNGVFVLSDVSLDELLIGNKRWIASSLPFTSLSCEDQRRGKMGKLTEAERVVFDCTVIG